MDPGNRCTWKTLWRFLLYEIQVIYMTCSLSETKIRWRSIMHKDTEEVILWRNNMKPFVCPRWTAKIKWLTTISTISDSSISASAKTSWLSGMGRKSLISSKRVGQLSCIAPPNRNLSSNGSLLVMMCRTTKIATCKMVWSLARAGGLARDFLPRDFLADDVVDNKSSAGLQYTARRL